MSQPVITTNTTVNTKERPVHSIDTEPKTGSKKGRLVSIILIFILIIIGVIFLMVGFNNKAAFQKCSQDESPFCYQITCAGVQTDTCGVYAFRCSADGYMRCSNDPYTDVPIKPNDAHYCQNNSN